MKREACHNCGFECWTIARGLCRRCVSDPEIFARFRNRRTGGRHHGRGSADRPEPPQQFSEEDYRRLVAAPNGAHPAPREPTRALPGTAAKVRVLEERAAAGLSLWHPLDPRVESEDIGETGLGIRVVRLPFRADD